MPQSLAKIYVHLIFSTKFRERVLTDEIRPQLHSYMGGILRKWEASGLEINTEPDHVHALFLLPRTHALSDVVGQLKRGSSVWLQSQDGPWKGFHWQNGYGAFSVSQSGVEEVKDYICNQREHHKKVTFQDEFRAFLKKYQVEFDERYVWD
jgi:REP-associated tyrosine transposase